MALDLRGFDVPEQSFEGLNKAADTLRSQAIRDRQFAFEQQGRQAATSKFVTDYLDPKQHLTGTNYDPQIVSGYQDILTQAQGLAAKGASTPDIMMAIGPSVDRLNQYSTKAKLINDQIKDSIGKLKGYPGYDPEKLEQAAKQQAFYGPDGKMKDISTIDPSQDYVTQATQNNPAAVTSGKGLDDFVAKTPMADYSRNVTTTYAGRSKINRVEAKHPFWEDLQRDQQGNVATDSAGAPAGLSVTGQTAVDDKGNPIIDPTTNQPFQVMDKGNFNAIMTHNPDVADYVRGQVQQHFKAAGAQQQPAEGSPQWDMMARHILGDELQSRSRSTFRTVDQQKETAPAVKVEIGNNPADLDATARYEAALKLKGQYSIYDPKQKKAVPTNAVEAVGKIFNNDPAYLSGDHVPVKDPNGATRDVIDVTDFMPGGGLKSGRGDDQVYKGIYYDPNKRSLLVTQQDKVKGANGLKAEDMTEIPESKAGLFMTKIAAANGVDPDKVSDVLKNMGYQGARFQNPASPGTIPADLSKEVNTHIDSALKDEKYDQLKGIQTPDGIIQKVNDRYIKSFLGAANKFSVDVKGPDGTVTTKYFKDKDALTQYIKGGQGSAPAVQPPASVPAAPSGIKWK